MYKVVNLNNIDQKVILVTGAGSGVGLACAVELAKQGHIVYGMDPVVENMRELQIVGGMPIYGDVTNQELIDDVISTINMENGRIDVVFANAGYGLIGPFENISIEEAMQQFNVNLFGVARTIKSALPYFKEKGVGRIIVTGGYAGYTPLPGMVWYPASKHAINALVHGLRMELSKTKIDVILVEPGELNTNFVKSALAGQEQVLKRVTDQELLKQQKALAKNLIKNHKKPSGLKTIVEFVSKAVNDKKVKDVYTDSACKSIRFFMHTSRQKKIDKKIMHKTIK